MNLEILHPHRGVVCVEVQGLMEVAHGILEDGSKHCGHSWLLVDRESWGHSYLIVRGEILGTIGDGQSTQCVQGIWAPIFCFTVARSSWS